MKVGITSDIHLGDYEKNPERFQALRYILESLAFNNINELIIAGDLFDKYQQDFSVIETLIKEFESIRIHVIPGNHDSSLMQKSIISTNLQVYSKPSFVKLFDSDILFFFIPYQVDQLIGNVLAEFAEKIRDKNWVLVSHGDFIGNRMNLNPYEPSVYMPLSQNDISIYSPRKVFLGHIHKPSEEGLVIYPGSPCGIDISETGKRSFLIYDVECNSIDINYIDIGHIYQNEVINIFPQENEELYFKKKWEEILMDWNLNDEEIERVVLRLQIDGYSSDRKEMSELIKKMSSRFKFYSEEEVDFNNLKSSEKMDMVDLLNDIQARVEVLEWNDSPVNLDKNQILEKILELIYGG